MVVAGRVEWVVRVADLAEHRAVEALLAEPLGNLYPGGRLWLARRLAAMPEAGRVTVLGSTGSPVAVALETWKPAGRVKLSTFYVAPEARRQGAGRALTASLTSRWLAEHRESAYVTVASQHSAALESLLRPFGFTPWAVSSARYGPGRDEHVLAWAAAPNGLRQL